MVDRTSKPAPIINTVTPAGRGTATSFASQVNGTWLAAQAQQAINNMQVHRAFDDARDPLIARQLQDDDLAKTETQRREEQSGGGQAFSPHDKATSEIEDGRTWLAVLRDQAMRNRAFEARQPASSRRDPARASPLPYRSPSP